LVGSGSPPWQDAAHAHPLPANVLALACATLLVPGIEMTSKQLSTDLPALVGVAVIFGVVNSVVKPLFRAAHSPVALVILGASLLVVNALLLLVTSWVCGLTHIPWHVDGFLPAIEAALLVSIVSFLVNALFGRRGEEHR